MSFDNDGPSHFTTWLTTINANGSPHVTALGAVWDGATFWFQTADRTRKAKNIVRDPRCAVSVTLNGFDVVYEGTAEKVPIRGRRPHRRDLRHARRLADAARRVRHGHHGAFNRAGLAAAVVRLPHHPDVRHLGDGTGRRPAGPSTSRRRLVAGGTAPLPAHVKRGWMD